MCKANCEKVTSYLLLEEERKGTEGNAVRPQVAFVLAAGS